MLRTGDKAPELSLPDTDMEFRTLEDFMGRDLVVYFYPKDDTPGCTIQANEFTELLDDFDAAGASVVGISTDDCFSHQAFRDKYGLKVTMLSDVDGDVSNAYGVMQEREKDGVKKVGPVRSTFVIDPQGVIKYAEYGVAPKGHAQKILALLANGG